MNVNINNHSHDEHEEKIEREAKNKRINFNQINKLTHHTKIINLNENC
jgi:hypothetical protein